MVGEVSAAARRVLCINVSFVSLRGYIIRWKKIAGCRVCQVIHTTILIFDALVQIRNAMLAEAASPSCRVRTDAVISKVIL